MRILLSIKPEFAAKILAGDKRFEFRKSAFANVSASCIVIYATKPVGKLVGEFDVEKVYVDAPEKIWDRTKKFAGIAKERYDEYYSGRSKAVAIAVGEVRKYKVPLDLASIGERIVPPQSFRYLPSDDLSAEKQLVLV
ncbi:ASCH domain-containing protein [Collimonas pratensis]|uniref:ASCH domain-containing protein n=1 Tax=Collimonas pratensis TaxID=279113 RepID=UPI0007865D07|nr:ASCH domain-containing protein [Collimonas pratensis]